MLYFLEQAVVSERRKAELKEKPNGWARHDPVGTWHVNDGPCDTGDPCRTGVLRSLRLGSGGGGCEHLGVCGCLLSRIGPKLSSAPRVPGRNTYRLRCHSRRTVEPDPDNTGERKGELS